MSTYGAVPTTPAQKNVTDSKVRANPATGSHSAPNSRVWMNVGRATLAGLAIVGTMYLGKGASSGGASSSDATATAGTAHSLLRSSDASAAAHVEPVPAVMCGGKVACSTYDDGSSSATTTDDDSSSATTTDDGSSTGSSKPHIVFFLLDDAGWNDFGYNSVDLSKASPNMDALAATGVTLHNYYTQVSQVPCRGSEGGGWRVCVGGRRSAVDTLWLCRAPKSGTPRGAHHNVCTHHHDDHTPSATLTSPPRPPPPVPLLSLPPAIVHSVPCIAAVGPLPDHHRFPA